jgi:hypothetical protein
MFSKEKFFMVTLQILDNDKNWYDPSIIQIKFRMIK